MITHKYALCRAKLRESDLLMGAINVAKHAPVVPVAAAKPEPVRLTLDQAMARYLNNASTKSPRTWHGYTYTLKQFRDSCAKQFLDEITKQDLYDFFLGSGCREQEVSHACWDDVNFESKTYTVREHLEIGFVPKDREERGVPLPDSLVTALQQRRLAHPDTKLIFPNQQGKPEGHFLRRLQTIAANAGLSGKFELHKFRKSFATMHHEAGVSARTLQKWLGHASLETTLAY